MRPLPFLLVLVCRLLVVATPASAQTLDEFGAWSALVRSPVGGTLMAPGHGRSESVARRAVSLDRGTWRFGTGDDETTNIGATLRLPAGRLSVVVSGMVTTTADCTDCGGFTLGGGVSYDLKSVPLGAADGARLDIGVQPMASFGSFVEGDVSAITASLSVPLSLTVPLGPVTLRPFLTPGYGFGQLSGDSQTYGGSMALFGYGFAVANRSGALQAHIGTMEVRLEDAPTVTAFGLTLRF
jgi:hypothetical protein